MELIRNGGFEEDPLLQGWLGGAELEISPISSHSGLRHAHLEIGSYLQQPLSEGFQRTYAVDGMLTVWACNRNETVHWLIVQVIYADPRMPGTTFHEVPPSSEWIRISVDLDTETPLSVLSIACTGDLYVDDVSLNGTRTFIFFQPLRMLARWFGLHPAPGRSRGLAPRGGTT